MDLDTMIASAQALADGLTALKNAPVPTPVPSDIAEVKIEKTDGTEEVVA